MEKSLTVEFVCENAAFGEEEEWRLEAARILRELAEKIEGGRSPRVLSDTNGNRVGSVFYEDLD